MRLILVTLGTFIFLGLIFLTLHFWGLGQQPDQFDHPWRHLNKPWLVVPLRLQTSAPESAFLWIDVVQSNNKNVHTKEGQELAKALAPLQNRNLVVNVLSNAENIDLQIADLLGPSAQGRVLVQSDYDVVMQSIKKLQPLWLFGASQAERVRLRSFQSMWLLPVAPFKGDVYVGPFQQRNITLFTAEIAEEMKRRNKLVLIGPLHSREEYNLALGLGADGVFIDSEELLSIISPL